jgi:hypothetical protein
MPIRREVTVAKILNGEVEPKQAQFIWVSFLTFGVFFLRFGENSFC